MSEIAIHLERVGKAYDLVTAAGNVFTRYIASRAHQMMRSEKFWAVRGIDLEVMAGTMLGVIGVNGSGKSTLLRLMAGIAKPTEGSVETRGRVIAMLEVGLGFHNDLTGYENIYLHAAVLGLSRAQIDERVGKIVAFAELEDFMEMPVKHYSSGMRSRLGFAVAINADPDIILVDEVLAVGDGAFQMKCVEAMRALHAAGKTIVYVTHNIRHAAKLCDRIAWIDGGTLRMIGESEDIAKAYRRALCERTLGPGPNGEKPVASLTKARLIETESTTPQCFRHGEPFALEVKGTALEGIDHPNLRLLITRSDFEVVGSANAHGRGCLPERVEGDFTWRVRWPSIFLNTGTYSADLALLDREDRTLARLEEPLVFHVEAPHVLDPEVLADLPCEFEVL